MSGFFHGLTMGNVLGILLCVLVIAVCIAEYFSPITEDHDHDGPDTP